jgi:predicted alpha/beta superfamily hydrolase
MAWGFRLKHILVVASGLLAFSLSACGDASKGEAPAPSLAKATDGGQRGNGLPYEVPGTEVWDVPDPVSGRQYQVFVNLPASYGEDPARRYPVLYVTDADYAFPIVRQIARRMNVERPRVEDFILVGLSYAKGDKGMTSRQRDYTPTPNGPSTAPKGAVHGQAAAYQAYLREQVKPFIEQRFRVNPARSLFLGHSYGSLLGTQILFTDPAMFSGYILGSPSLWYDKREAFKMESAYAAGHKDLPAHVYMYVGEYEAARPGDARFNSRTDMVADTRAMEAQLKTRAYPGLKLKSEVLNDEDHVSVAPRGFTRGLLELLPAK